MILVNPTLQASLPDPPPRIAPDIRLAQAASSGAPGGVAVGPDGLPPDDLAMAQAFQAQLLAAFSGAGVGPGAGGCRGGGALGSLASAA